MPEYADKLDAASEAVLTMLNALLKKGHDSNVLGDALLGYGLSIMQQNHGRENVARHLYVLALKFADPQQEPLKDAQRSH